MARLIAETRAISFEKTVLRESKALVKDAETAVAVMERRAHKKIVIFRPLYPVGGQELGYLPGSEGEKMSPWAQAVFDTLGA